jgi:hypothetical protein
MNMIDHSNRHPHALGEHFETMDDEIKWARHKPSSRDLEAVARLYSSYTQVTRTTIMLLEQLAANYAAIVEDKAHHTSVRYEAAKLSAQITSAHLPALRIELQKGQGLARQYRQDARKAHLFELRWSFDPYTDPLLDKLEQWGEKMLRQQERRKNRKRKSSK